MQPYYHLDFVRFVGCRERKIDIIVVVNKMIYVKNKERYCIVDSLYVWDCIYCKQMDGRKDGYINRQIDVYTYTDDWIDEFIIYDVRREFALNVDTINIR